MTRWLRTLEMIVLFGAAPLALTLAFERPPVIPPLVVAFALCLVVLFRDPSFPRVRLWNGGRLRKALPGILTRLAVGGSLLVLGITLGAPDELFSFPRREPVIWALVMLGYPLLSVGPQEVIFRAFFLHRYRSLLGPATLIASAVAFAWAHVLFRNFPAIALTLPAGLLFARTYRRTRSLACAVVEHALWGDLIFTLGLGRYFYSGLGF